MFRVKPNKLIIRVHMVIERGPSMTDLFDLTIRAHATALYDNAFRVSLLLEYGRGLDSSEVILLGNFERDLQ